MPAPVTPSPREPILLPWPTMVAVVTLGLTQIIAWGTSFYALGVLAQPIMSDLGWDNTTVFGAFTVSLLISGLISAPAGWAIDRFGARLVMTVGSLLLAGALKLLADVETVLDYYVAWAALGVAMRLVLYDAAFAALVQVDAGNGRRAIAYLTLFGGLASTAGWPAGHALAEAFGWRATFEVYALVNLAVTMPLAFFGLSVPIRRAGDEQPSLAASRAPQAAPLEGRARAVAMVLFSVVMSANAFIFGVGAVHLVGLIEASGVGAATAVALAAMKGVAQVAGRVWELVFGRNLAPMMLGRLAIGLLPLALAILLFAGGGWSAALAFTLVFGVSNGLVTIVRGAVPLALFGPKGYGLILGILATPVLLFNAISPLAFAAIVDGIGYDGGTWVLLGVAIAASSAMEVLAVWYRRRMTVAAASQDLAGRFADDTESQHPQR